MNRNYDNTVRSSMVPEFDTLQKQLQDARQEITKRLGKRDEVYIERTADSTDQVQAAEARELAIRNLDRSALRLHQIEDALQRLATGEYGACAQCEGDIGAKRLRAVPLAHLCLQCQELADRSKSGLSELCTIALLSDAA